MNCRMRTAFQNADGPSLKAAVHAAGAPAALANASVRTASVLSNAEIARACTD